MAKAKRSDEGDIAESSYVKPLLNIMCNQSTHDPDVTSHKVLTLLCFQCHELVLCTSPTQDQE